MAANNTPWLQKGAHLYRKFTFQDFIQAFSFMTAVAFEAEKSNHHPTWTNTYNAVEIYLRTHSADAVTAKDHELAEKIDRIAARFQPKH